MASNDVKLRIRAQNKSDPAFNKAKRNVTGLTRATKVLGGALSAAFVARSARNLVLFTDNFNKLNTRLRTATRETRDFTAIQKQLLTLSVRTGTAFESTVTTFQALSRVREDIGATNAQFVQLTRTVEQLGVIGGSSNEALKFGLRQFNQALAAGVFRAEEFNSIVENLPELAFRMAKGLNVTQGELRQMVIQGRVFAKDVMRAILEQSTEISRQFANIPADLGRGFSSLKTGLGAALSDMDSALGVTKALAEAMTYLGKRFLIASNKATPLVAATAKLEKAEKSLAALKANPRTANSDRVTELEREITLARFLVNLSTKDNEVQPLTRLQEWEQTLRQLEKSTGILFALNKAKELREVLKEMADQQTAEEAQIRLFSKNDRRVLEEMKDAAAFQQADEEALVRLFADGDIQRLQAAKEKMRETQQLADSFARTFADNLVQSASNGFDDLLGMFKRTVAQMVATWASTQIFKFGQSLFGGLFGAGGTSVNNTLPGFANGADFTVGGRSGTDSNLVAFNATRGERVQVSRPGQSGGGGGITIHNTVDARGADAGAIERAMRASEERTIAQVRDLVQRNRL